MKLYNLIKRRWKAESPAFFKKLKKAAFILGGSCIAMITVINTMSLVLPSIVTTVLGYIVVLCAGIAGTSQLTKQ